METITHEEEVHALATITKDDLTHLRDLQKEITRYREDYYGLQIIDETDAEGYEKVRLALGVMRPKRTSLEAERKEKGKPYAETIKYINSQYGEVISAIAEIEAPLKERKKEIDEIDERRKEEERIAAETRVNERVNAIIKAGGSFDGNYYSVGDDELFIPEISVGIVDIRSMTDKIFDDYLRQFTDKNAKIQEARAAIKAKKDAEEKERRDQEQKERDAFKKQQDEFAEQQRIFKEQQDGIKAQQNTIIQKRQAQLRDAGFYYAHIGEQYVYETVRVDRSFIEDIKTDWDGEFKSIMADVIHAKKIREEKDKLLKAEEEKELEKRVLEHKKLSDRQAEEKRVADLAAASDKVKWEDLIVQLRSIVIPEMKSKKYKELVAPVRDFIDDL